MKELTIEEVLRIAGGVPPLSALEEVTYRVPQATPRDPIEEARLAESLLRSPVPE